MATTRFASLIFSLVVTGVVHAVAPSEYNVVSKTTGGVAVSTKNVTYQCTLLNEWTATRHPFAYPSNPQFNTPLIVSHTSDYRVWAPGTTANSGLQNFVENGSPDNFLFDLLSTTKVLDEQVGSDQNVLLLTQQTLPAIHVDQQHSFLSTLTPFSPSPDWFSGFYAFNTIDSGSNTFLKSFTIDVFPWDAGTRSGTTYTDTGSKIIPFQPITEINVNTVPSTGVFLNPQRSGVLPVAKWTCQLSVPTPAVPAVTPSTKRPRRRRPIATPVRQPAPVKRTAKRPK